jgi:hypothetical protein
LEPNNHRVFSKQAEVKNKGGLWDGGQNAIIDVECEVLQGRYGHGLRHLKASDEEITNLL